MSDPLKPEALRLADALDWWAPETGTAPADLEEAFRKGASELRRLHAEVERLTEECRIWKACDQGMQQSLGEYHTERDELRVEVSMLTEELARERSRNA
jgi:uncharacterized coiled-coil DUF342 family protein